MKLFSDYFLDIIATFFYVGYAPYCPGTAASFIAALIAFFIPEISIIYTVPFLIFLFFVGVWSTKIFAAKMKLCDPSQAVIDEVVGMWLSLIFVPKNIWFYLLAFVLFRFFDISKVYPINKSEKLKGGWGIMLDDVIAGLFTSGIVYLCMFFSKSSFI